MSFNETPMLSNPDGERTQTGQAWPAPSAQKQPSLLQSQTPPISPSPHLAPTSSRLTPASNHTATKKTPSQRKSLSSSTSRRRSPWSHPSRKRPLPGSPSDAVIDLTDDDGDKGYNNNYDTIDIASSGVDRGVQPPAPKPPSRALLLMNMHVAACDDMHPDRFPAPARVPATSMLPSPPSVPKLACSPLQMTRNPAEEIEESTSEPAAVVATSRSAAPSPPNDPNLSEGLPLPRPSVAPPPPPSRSPPPLSDAERGKVRERPMSIYLRHFEDVMGTVMRARPDYARLFTPEEREVVRRFEALSGASQSLYVRLFQRKGPWFRVDGMLGYDEVGSGTPLWIRRLRAESAAAAATAVSGVGVDGVGGVGDVETNTTRGATGDTDNTVCTGASPDLPLNPFAPTAGEESTPERYVLGGKGNAVEASQGQDVKCSQGVDQSTKDRSLQDAVTKRAALLSSTSMTAAVGPPDVAAGGLRLSSEELTVLHSEIQSALRELIGAGFLSQLPDNIWRAQGPGLEAALSAADCCLRSGEIKTLLMRTAGGGIKATSRSRSQKKGGKPAKPGGRPSLADSGCSGGGGGGGSTKGTAVKDGRKAMVINAATSSIADSGAGVGGRPGMIAELRRRLAGQQTLWGAKLPLVKEIERLVSSSVEALGVDVAGMRRQDSHFGGGDRIAIIGKTESFVDSSGDHAKDDACRQHWIVLVADSPRLVFKRALRLLYLTCNTSALSSGMVGAASVRGAGASGALSSWSPGLSAAFGKVRYASYTCDVRGRAFEGREDFLRWEAAVELRCALDGAMAELPRGWAQASTTAASGIDDDEDSCDGGGEGQSEVEVLDTDGDEFEETSRRRRNYGKSMSEMEEGSSGIVALGGLEDSISQFLSSSAEDTISTSADTASAVTASTSAAACPAVTIALVCARCLNAHLNTRRPPATIEELPSPAILGIAAKAGTMERSVMGQKAFLGILKESCSSGGGGAGCADSGAGGAGSVGRRPSAPNSYPAASTAATDRDRRTCAVAFNNNERPCGGRNKALLTADEGPAARQTLGSALDSEISSDFDQSIDTSKDSSENGGEIARLSSLGQPGATRDATGAGETDKAGADDGDTDGSAAPEVPAFLLQLDAGWVLASAVWEGVSLLERARDYGRAVELLAQLLATRYTPHRRGRWWNRLSLDLAHVGRLSCSLWAAEEGVRDARVRGGDRLALEKRAAVLATRLAKKTAKVAKTCSNSSGKREATESTSPNLPPHVAAPRGAPPTLEPPPVPAATATDGCCVAADPNTADDDGDDVFVDPTVDRERRRKHRRRRREKRRRPADDDDPAASTKRATCGGAHAIQDDDDGDDGEAEFASMDSRDAKPSDGGESAAAGYELGKRTATTKNLLDKEGCARRGTDNTGGFVGGGGGGGSGGGSDFIVGGEGCTAKTACSAGSHNAPTAQATASLALTSLEGLAELSDVPDLLRDESIGAVVLAAATESAETPTAETTRGGNSGSGGASSGGGGSGGSGGAGCGIFGVTEITITGRRLNREAGVKSRFVGYGEGAACTVESLVLQHLCREEEGSWAGWHCEGSPLRALWALLMWDVIFTDLPDVFQTPFQDAPLDLDFCPLFYLNRREAVDARLREIRGASPVALAGLVAESWSANSGTVCRGIRWETTSVRYLQAIAAGLGGRTVAAVLAALCINHKHFGGGLPDLLLMRAVRQRVGGGDVMTAVEDASVGGLGGNGSTAPLRTPVDGGDPEVSTPERFVSWLGVDSGAASSDEAKWFGAEMMMKTISGDRAPVARSNTAKAQTRATSPPPFLPQDMEGLRVETWLLEVKGPSDRLSDRQTAWLRILHHGGARVGVCHVSEGEGGSHVFE